MAEQPHLQDIALSPYSLIFKFGMISFLSASEITRRSESQLPDPRLFQDLTSKTVKPAMRPGSATEVTRRFETQSIFTDCSIPLQLPVSKLEV